MKQRLAAFVSLFLFHFFSLCLCHDLYPRYDDDDGHYLDLLHRDIISGSMLDDDPLEILFDRGYYDVLSDDEASLAARGQAISKLKGDKFEIWIQFSDGTDYAHRFHWAFMVVPAGEVTGVKYHIVEKGILGPQLVDPEDQSLHHGLGRVKIGAFRGDDKKRVTDKEMFAAGYRDILKDPVVCRTWMIRVMELLEADKILDKGTAVTWEALKNRSNDQIKSQLTGKGWVS